MKRTAKLALAAAALAVGAAATATETITYTYDTLGRLKTASTAGGPNAGTTVTTSYDKAGNRTNYVVTGAGAAGAAATIPAVNVIAPPTEVARSSAEPSNAGSGAVEAALAPQPVAPAAAELRETAR